MKNTTQKYTNARLGAIQCLYMNAFTPMTKETLITKFVAEGMGKILLEETGNFETAVDLDKRDDALMSKLIETALDKKDDLENMIKAALSEEWDFDKMEVLLKSILQIALSEFFVQPSLDAPIIINEYTDITHSFYEGSEVKMVNALLDKFSKVIRD
ncbi:MAG: transcription antitermination protein NusB [Alphaproteobacteria bacterium]|nr:transcription antitermination protein NusB [Alphaproteobacteria bacterium]